MSKRSKNILIIVGLIVVFALIVWAWVRAQNRPDVLDDFARCLEERDAVFYGAFWCPHCQNQKAMFGRSDRLIPYVECSTPAGTGQTAECQQKDIMSYPTWEFADGSRLTGEIALETLAEKTGCTLPETR